MPGAGTQWRAPQSRGSVLQRPWGPSRKERDRRERRRKRGGRPLSRPRAASLTQRVCAQSSGAPGSGLSVQMAKGSNGDPGAGGRGRLARAVELGVAGMLGGCTGSLSRGACCAPGPGASTGPPRPFSHGACTPGTSALTCVSPSTPLALLGRSPLPVTDICPGAGAGPQGPEVSWVGVFRHGGAGQGVPAPPSLLPLLPTQRRAAWKDPRPRGSPWACLIPGRWGE